MGLMVCFESSHSMGHLFGPSLWQRTRVRYTVFIPTHGERTPRQMQRCGAPAREYVKFKSDNSASNVSDLSRLGHSQVLDEGVCFGAFDKSSRYGSKL
jgi:hypothetical protein